MNLLAPYFTKETKFTRKLGLIWKSATFHACWCSAFVKNYKCVAKIPQNCSKYCRKNSSMHSVKNLPLTVDFQFLPLNHFCSENSETKQSNIVRNKRFLIYTNFRTYLKYIYLYLVSVMFLLCTKLVICSSANTNTIDSFDTVL